MTYVDEILDRFAKADPKGHALSKGVAVLARACGHNTVTTVHSWKRAGKIPPWRKHEVDTAAKSVGIDISDLWPSEVSA